MRRMTVGPGAVALTLGALVFVALFPASGVTSCAAAGDCSSSFETFWGLPLPGGAWSSAPALALGSLAGWVTYRRVRDPQA
jgi:hypothetical protein